MKESIKEQRVEFDGEEDVREEESQINEIKEYDLTSTPNDFNIITLGSFINSGAIQIPGFQRNYVWDLKKASRLIESLILGLPVPQIFLYEQERNKFLVIDGQQRLMTIYYFINGRFPKQDKRPEIRKIFSEQGSISEEVFKDESYFSDFKLNLPAEGIGEYSKYHKLSYENLGDYKTQFDLRPIRNIIVKQNIPKDDDSSIYEIFNRLNSGGVNLKSQEIRSSLFHSKFYEMVHKINLDETWRKILKNPNLDLHLRDFELLLRTFSFIYEKENYKAPLVKFLNKFSRIAKDYNSERIFKAEKIFKEFMDKIKSFDKDDLFINEKTGRFNVFLFESVFYAVCREAILNDLPLKEITIEKIKNLKEDSEFI